MDGQVPWLDLGISCGKTWSEPLAATKEKTSQPSSKRSSKSSSRKPPSIEVPEKGWTTWGGYHDEVGGRWSVVWRTHDAQYWGVPQRRRRISVVADFGGDTASEIQFDGESVPGDIAESGASGEGVAGAAESGFNPAVARSLTARADGSPCADRGPNIVCSPHQGGL